MIKPNPLKQKLKEGKTVFGPIVNFQSTWFVDVAGLCGFDFVLLDAEHGPLSPSETEPMVRAAEAAGLVPLVRVLSDSAAEMLRFLDIGAMGLKVPRIESGTQAGQIVQSMRYAPDGIRGLAGSTRAAGYGASLSLPDYCKLANEAIMALAMVETREGVSHIDDIAQTLGVDMICLGPGDLSQSMGYRGAAAPEVERAIDHVIERTKKAGKAVSLPAFDATSVKRVIDRGADVVFISPARWLIESSRPFFNGCRST
jgi:4-hydroxy-2-oxoheptanedioate aldolase